MAEHVFTDENFEKEVIKSDIPVLVDFYADWCGPCKMMAPIIDEIAEETKGKWKVGKLNVDEAVNVAGKYGIQSIPTLMFFKDGKVIDMLLGFRPKDTIMDKMK
ncbi:MAG: thioredoxin [Candidatus Gracilibacteria bacterium]|jgi:thioredoxin 1